MNMRHKTTIKVFTHSSERKNKTIYFLKYHFIVFFFFYWLWGGVEPSPLPPISTSLSVRNENIRVIVILTNKKNRKL